MNHTLGKLFALAAIGVGLVVFPRETFAQRVTRLIEYTNVWNYNDSGADLGTAWRESGYDDSAWPSGPGLLGVEASIPYPYGVPMQTALNFSGPDVVTCYFRTRFHYTESHGAVGLVLRADCFIDDGCAIYLNGTLAARVRIPEDYNYRTICGFSEFEGLNELRILDTNLLAIGENVVAVEVHKSLPDDADLVWGMRLSAITPEPLAITLQPESQTSIASPGSSIGSQVSFHVAVSGGPVAYQWRKDGIDIPNGFGATFYVAQPFISDSGEYSVVVSNALGSVTSSNAALTFVPDQSLGLQVVSAIVRGLGISNSIDLTFSKPISASSATSISNYVLRLSGTTNTTAITNIVSNDKLVRLRVDANGWMIGGDYYLTINGVRAVSLNGNGESSTNVIPPDTQIGITWPVTFLGVDQGWSYHAATQLEPFVLDTEWYRNDYTESTYWQHGAGGFNVSNCLGNFRTMISWQGAPVLFRTSFYVPPDLAESVRHRLNVVATAGVVLYLNGEEIFRYNLPQPPAQIEMFTRPDRWDAGFGCPGDVPALIKLLPGSNCLAAAVFRCGSFAARVTSERTSPVPVSPSAQLATTWMDGTHLQLSWTGAGYALETATNITTVGTNTIIGPWIEAPDMANPYSITVGDEPLRLFRLRK